MRFATNKRSVNITDVFIPIGKSLYRSFDEKIMAKEDIDRLIDGATEVQLREIVREWMSTNGEFRTFVERSLNPPFDEIDFDAELGRALMHEAQQCISRRGDEILDWRNIFNYQIEPWAKRAESLNTSSLWELIVAIITRVAMVIDDDDFNGYDWYGNDYSQDIGNILETLGNLCGLLVTRQDLKEERLSELEKIVGEAQAEDKIGNYMDTPYSTIQELIGIRREAEEVCCGLYDVMIDADYNHEAGVWVCRKIDFVRSMGLSEEADSEISQNLRYPEVTLKRYNELTTTERWNEAIALLDKAVQLKKDESNRWLSFNRVPDWLAMKQQLLMEHGTKEDQIANLVELFHQSPDDTKMQYYENLRDLISPSEWKDFYTKLLSSESGYFALDNIAPFLVLEDEYSWLYRLLAEHEAKDKSDYRTPLKYAAFLMAEYNKEMRAMMVRTFRNYAEDRFGYKKKVKSGKYSYFSADLRKLEDAGMAEELRELVAYFRNEYKTRPSLMEELRKIKLS